MGIIDPIYILKETKMADENKPMEKERSFSVELKSKVNLKNITLNNDSRENAVIEGTIGKLEHAEFVDTWF